MKKLIVTTYYKPFDIFQIEDHSHITIEDENGKILITYGETCTGQPIGFVDGYKAALFTQDPTIELNVIFEKRNATE